MISFADTMDLFCFLFPFDWFSRQVAKSGNGSLKRLDTTADSFVKHRKLALRSVDRSMWHSRMSYSR